MGKVFQKFLVADVLYSCAHCQCHLATHGDIVSKAFMGRQGRAYLYRSLVNVNLGVEEDRHLSSGLHIVSDVYCNGCCTKLGWKYVFAYSDSQKYKEGTFIVEVLYYSRVTFLEITLGKVCF